MPQQETKRSAEYEWRENLLYRGGFKGAQVGETRIDAISSGGGLISWDPSAWWPGAFSSIQTGAVEKCWWWGDIGVNLQIFRSFVIGVSTIKTSNELGHIGGGDFEVEGFPGIFGTRGLWNWPGRLATEILCHWSNKNYLWQWWACTIGWGLSRIKWLGSVGDFTIKIPLLFTLMK